MSSMNLKQQVKEGKLTPEEALKLLEDNADDMVAASNSRTGRWLRSDTAQKRYKAAKKSQK